MSDQKPIDFSAFDNHPSNQKSVDFSSFDNHPSIATNSSTEPSAIEAALRGTANGVTLGAAPAISALGQSFVNSSLADFSPAAHLAKLLGYGSDYKSFEDSRAKSKKEFDSAEKAHPYVYGGTSLAASALPMVALPEIGATGALAKAGITGAELGGLSGLGSSLSNGDDISDTAQNTVTGAAAGGVLGPVVHAAGNAVGKTLGAAGEAISQSDLYRGLLDKVKGFAAKKAVAATGANPGQISKLVANGDINKVGQSLLDNKIVTPLATPGKIFDRSQALVEKAGQDIGNAIPALDKAGATIAPGEMADTVQKQMIDPLMQDGSIIPTGQAQADSAQNLIDAIRSSSSDGSPISLSDAQKLKLQLASTLPPGPEKSQALGILTDFMNSSAEQAAQDSGSPELLSNIMKAKSDYSAGLTGSNMALKGASREIKNHEFGLKDLAAGAMGAASHGNPGLAAGVLGSKALRTYGNSLAATGANSVSKAMDGTLSDSIKTVSGKICNMTPDLLRASAKTISDRLGPDSSLGKNLSNVFNKMADKDGIGRNAAVFALMQNPAYRQLLTHHFGSDSQ